MYEKEIPKSFRDIMAKISVGVIEKFNRPKESEMEENKYKESSILDRGRSDLAAFAYENGYTNLNGLPKVPLFEQEFFDEFLCQDVGLWLEQNWGEETRNILWAIDSGPLLSKYHNGYEVQDIVNELAATAPNNPEYQQFKFMQQVWNIDNQEAYVYIRKFIIQHSIMTVEERRKFHDTLSNKFGLSTDKINDLEDAAYESIPSDAEMICKCGWTVCRNRYKKLYCYSGTCNRQTSGFKIYCEAIKDIRQSKRVKQGIQRFIVAPGKLELDLESEAQRKGCKTELWPEIDKYDLKIITPQGDIIMIDAKDWANAYYLADDISANGLQLFESVKKSSAKAYVVVPDNKSFHKDYTKIVNKAIKLKCSKVSCITKSELLKRLNVSSYERKGQKVK